MSKQHRGEIVHAAVLRSGVKVARLYQALGVSRPTLYRRFEDPNLDFDFIKRVGEVIYYNFADDFRELAPAVAEPLELYQVTTLEASKDRLLHVYGLYIEKVQQYDELKARYDALLREKGG